MHSSFTTKHFTTRLRKRFSFVTTTSIGWPPPAFFSDAAGRVGSFGSDESGGGAKSSLSEVDESESLDPPIAGGGAKPPPPPCRAADAALALRMADRALMPCSRVRRIPHTGSYYDWR